jgi:TRAP-type C4-dicarboxylate transport system permease small subunit
VCSCFCRCARHGNIFVDTFTCFLPPDIRRGLDALWDVVYALIIAFVGVAMLQGAREQYATKVQTVQLSVPIWPFNLAAALLLLLLAAVSLATALRLVSARNEAAE